MTITQWTLTAQGKLIVHSFHEGYQLESGEQLKECICFYDVRPFVVYRNNKDNRFDKELEISIQNKGKYIFKGPQTEGLFNALMELE
tara:strand:- start:6542 stop:6802 length:261 start_codon:yes stop_codon:yes gene_type:complete